MNEPTSRAAIQETVSTCSRGPSRSGQPAVRHLVFLSICVVSLVLFRAPIQALANLAFQDDRYTFTIVIPLLSCGLVWMGRKTIFTEARNGFGIGLAIASAALVLILLTTRLSPASIEYILAVKIFVVLLVWAGAFVLCYGVQAARRSLFPLALLLLMLPAPASFMQLLVVFFQRGSAEVTYRLFHLIQVPVFRESLFQFSLPGDLTIEIAEECSGIRSSLSLFVSSIVAGYLFLRSGWARSLFSLLTIPIVIFKNAVRIVTLSWLSVYIDAGFLSGRLHRYGGLPFSLLAVAPLVAVLLILMRAEGPRVVIGEDLAGAIRKKY